ncbi:non-ribosomal peptide synthetase, partial [Corallococcus praedator]|uniref:non-ribosomal peptide synthetase n=1 Tax=Corallococcus praedator TaxID=2316724 RepID=UPI0011C4155D
MHSKNTLLPPGSAASSLVELLRQAAAERADQRLYTFLGEAGEDEATLTYGALDVRARQIGAALQQRVAPGTRALLLYPPGPEYIAGFFGCLYAGLVAVPAYPPDPTRLERTVPRLRAIIEDARAEVVLTTDFIASMGEFLFEQAPELRALHWMATDALPPEAAGAWRPPVVGTDSLAFLQYTSGSTGAPKGVRLSHGNLLHNLASISRAFQTRPDSTGVIWLPPYHDMGLIGGILEPLYQGFHTALMSPLTFLRQPLRWLEAVSRFGGTISGGPNFAFDLCVRKIAPELRSTLDLSRWEVAFCGAEPIRAETLDRFAEAFAPSGFRREAFYPCYGLAEGTLIVSGGAKSAVPVLRSLETAALEQHRAVPAAEGAPGARTFVGSGGSLPDQEIVIVDPETRSRLEPGAVGEIWVAGPSIAQGYWERPEETAQTFGARLAGEDTRTFLRTGDLGVLLDGELFVTGRRKDLIILRGRNHYPQDLELTVEQTHPALRPGCGAAFAVDVDGEERLVVAQEVDARKHGDLDELMGQLRQRLAERHEVRPHALVLLEAGALPKTSSGKVQRRASRSAFLAGELPSVRVWREADDAGTDPVPEASEPDAVPVAQGDAVESWLRARLAARAHVRPEQVDAEEPITRLGLDSLGAAELANDIEQGWGAVLPLEALLRGPSLRELTALVRTRREAGLPPLLPVARTEALALSFAQQRLWFLDQLDPSSSLYNLAVALRLEGWLNVAALERAFEEVLRRHEALRTTFVVSDGGPTQIISPEGAFTLSVVEVEGSEADLLRQAEAAARDPFNLERGPLLRAVLLRNASRGDVLVVTVHHIVFDGASMGVMIREVSALYATFAQGLKSPLPALPIQYADFAAWQRQALRGEALEAQLSWWRQELEGAPQSLSLPTDFPRPSVQSFRGSSLRVHVPRALAQAVEALSLREGVTPFMTLLASFQLLLHRYSAQDDFCVGAPIAGRNRSSLEGLIGFFVNTLVHRARFSGNPSFLSHLARVKHSALGAFAHQDVPFEKLVEALQPERDLGRTPLFQVMFTLQPDALPQLALPGLVVHPLELHSATSKFDLGLSLTRTPDGFVGAFEFSTDLFEASTVQRLSGHLLTLLESVVARPEAPIGELSLLSAEDKHRVLVEWNDTARPYPSDASIPEVFAAQVALFPDAIAVEFGEQRLTYRQLDALSNQLSRVLVQRGVGPDSPVALCLERSLELVVSLVAILKAGGAYLPLDASYPRQRLAFMLEDVPPQLLLTSRELLPSLPTEGIEVLLIEDVAPTLPLQSEAPLRVGIHPEHLAYIDFTSGSTGRPKPVGTTHRAVLRTVRGVDYARLGPGESFLLIAPISFDASTLEVWGPLLNGSRLVVFPPHSPSDVPELVRVLNHHRVSTLHLTAGLFSQVIDSHLDGLRHLRQLLTGGDVVSSAHFQRALDALRIPVTACYGPTESTLFASTWTASPPASVGPSVPIGRPLANTQLFLLDAYLQPVPPGLPGEVFLAGDGLARGYLANPSLSAERFLPNPFASSPGARMYRTGDLARHRLDGTLDFLGRLDSQVKVRGFRVEIAEVESALLAHPDVREAVVIAREDSPGLKRLVAYFTSDAPPSTEALRSFLASRLPDYMLPAAFLHLAALPLTANAKLDRKAL